MTKINGYEDCHIVNGGDDFADKLAAHEVQCMKNDQFKAGFLLGRKYATSTKEELVEVMASKMWVNRIAGKEACKVLAIEALDALIAIGEVRVK